jgi:hypothetical protein
VVVDTSESESKVGGGQIEMAPQGTTDWTEVPTTVNGSGQLVGTIDDAGLSGPYTIQATACSQVGNCGSNTETLTLPLRAEASSDVSFDTIADPLVPKKVTERVRVGWHWVAVLRDGKALKVKRGGHWKTVTKVKWVEECTRTRTKVGRHRWKLVATCRAPRIAVRGTETEQYGQSVTVHGLLVTKQDVPIGNARVQLLTAPANGLDQFTPAGWATTNADGNWSATLPSGPSRIIEASYQGSTTLLPASGQATARVPAKISLSATPRRQRWAGWITLHGQLEGGYVPPDGVALRLLVRYPGARVGTPLLALRTTATGAFTIRWSFHAGRGAASLPFWVATDSNESDYPFLASTSRRVSVAFNDRITGSQRARTRTRSQKRDRARVADKARSTRRARHARR